MTEILINNFCSPQTDGATVIKLFVNDKTANTENLLAFDI
jgi:hypothetical protein